MRRHKSNRSTRWKRCDIQRDKGWEFSKTDEQHENSGSERTSSEQNKYELPTLTSLF